MPARQPVRWPTTRLSADPRFHIVKGIECKEVTVLLPKIGQITILEATAEAQEDLVNLALQEETTTELSLPSGDPYGAVLWPAASAIATYLIGNDLLQGRTLLEVGTGTGLVSLAACKGGAQRVMATDYEQVPLHLLDYAASTLNELSNVPLLDYFDIYDTTPLPEADIVVAADIMYEPRTGKAMARRAAEAVQRGSRVLIGDSPGRAGRPAFLEELRRLGIEADFVDTQGSTVTGDRHELICGPGSSSVSVEPQSLTVAIMDLLPGASEPC